MLLPFVLRGHHAGNLHFNRFGGDGLANVAIHPRELASLAVLFKHIGGHSYDGQMPSG